MKRTTREKMDFYSAELKRLQEKDRKIKRRRILVLSDSSDSDKLSDNEQEKETAQTKNDNDGEAEIPIGLETIAEEKAVDPDLLSALGDSADEVAIYGEKINPLLADRWIPILRKGINKEVKEKLLKEYNIPENCKLLKAPTLNAEITAAITDISRSRDKKIEASQQQLGIGISAINKAMSILLTSEDKPNKILAMKILSDGCRVLSDLHYLETVARTKLLTPGLDKAFLNVMQDFERDETLFGNKLSEKIKASKAIEKQGLQIKKNMVTVKNSTASTSQPQSTTRPRFQGNWSGPARFQSPNRGGRVGPQRSFPPVRRAPPPGPAPAKTSGYSKPRAPTRQ